MKILIFEPNEEKRRELISLLETSLEGETLFSCHQPGEIFTLPMPADADLTFITVNCMAEVEAARQFKRLHPCIPLVVISDSADYAVESFTFPAADYLTRPLQKNTLASALWAVSRRNTEGGEILCQPPNNKSKI